MFGLVEVLRINPDGEIHRAAVLEAELRGARDELASNERKEVAGLRERVDVGDLAAAVLKHAVHHARTVDRTETAADVDHCRPVSHMRPVLSPFVPFAGFNRLYAV